MLTPYQFFSNNPIQNIDLDGLEGVPFQASISGISQYATQSTYVQRVEAKTVSPPKPTAESSNWFSKFFSPHKDGGKGGNVDLVNSGGSNGSDKKYNPSSTGTGTQQLDMKELSQLFGTLGITESPSNALEALDFLHTGIDMAKDKNEAAPIDLNKKQQPEKKAQEELDSCTGCGKKAGKSEMIKDRYHPEIVPAKDQTSNEKTTETTSSSGGQ